MLRMRPQFIAYAVKDLPSTVTSFARKVLRLPVLAWTVRSGAKAPEAAGVIHSDIERGFIRTRAFSWGVTRCWSGYSFVSRRARQRSPVAVRVVRMYFKIVS